jgi:hypothetical protein
MIIPQKKLLFFSPSEINLIICGVPDINVDELENTTVFQAPYHKDTQSSDSDSRFSASVIEA